jgi:hypothetical protein
MRRGPKIGAISALSSITTDPDAEQASSALQLKLGPVLGCLLSRTHKLKGADNLFAIRVHVNLASGPIGELVLVVGRNRIAEHQCINDPDCSRLHCETPHVRPLAENERQPHPRSIVTEAADQVHRAIIALTGKATSPQFCAENLGNRFGARSSSAGLLAHSTAEKLPNKKEDVPLTSPRHEQHVLESAGCP